METAPHPRLIKLAPLHRWTVLPEAGNLLKARAAVEKKREQS
jgi:hypothetical protein